MLQHGCQRDLPLEPLLVHTRRHVGRQYLDHDLAAEPGLVGQEDTAHPPATELPLDGAGDDRSLQTS
jgi:hypothetical protein